MLYQNLQEISVPPFGRTMRYKSYVKHNKESFLNFFGSAKYCNWQNSKFCCDNFRNAVLIIGNNGFKHFFISGAFSLSYFSMNCHNVWHFILFVACY